MPVVDVQLTRNVALACTGVRANGVNSGMICAGLTPPPIFVTVTPPPPLGVVPVEVDR